MLRAVRRVARTCIEFIYIFSFLFFFFTSIDGGENFAYNLPILRRFDQERWT